MDARRLTKLRKDLTSFLDDVVGTLGKVASCQVAVTLQMATPREVIGLDAELYLPQSWVDDRKRMTKSGVAAANVDQRIIDEFMGHTTEAMRKRYRHLFPHKRRGAIESLTF